MSRWLKTCLIVLMVFAMAPVMPALAQSDADCLLYGTQTSGAKYCITMPPPGYWNGDLVIFAHGYVSINDPLDIPWSQMTFSDGNGGAITVPFLVNSMGYAFATTSYSVNGLAVKQGIADVLDLIEVFKVKVGTPNRVFLVGASEGGLVTTLALEKYPSLFSGGLAMCGPVGSFVGQVNYWGDFRVVFDYFMDTPAFDVLPGTAVNIPRSLMNKWESGYAARVGATLASNPVNTSQLFSVKLSSVSLAASAPFDTANPLTMGETALGILWYNVFATNDAIVKLGGQPYDNFDRMYTGSFNDTRLNAAVKRFKAKPNALAEIALYYETSGVLARPLVTMHTTGDPVVPAWHQTLYGQKVLAQNPNVPGLTYWPLTYDRYGHCSFTLPEIVSSFGQLVFMSTGAPPPLPPVMLGAGVQSYELGN